MPENHAAPDYETARATAWQTAVEALTDAAQLSHPRYGQLDFADFLASALTTVAANVGSVDRLLSGRSGSWEADLVDRLVGGSVGDDAAYLTAHRTRPVVIHLNVARLAEEAEPLHRSERTTPYEQERDAADDRFAQLDDDQYDPNAEQAAFTAIQQKWAARYAAYAGAFTSAVLAEAARIRGLTVPVTVEATTDPDARTDRGLPHPGGYEDPDPDPLVWRLWCAALETAPLPGPHDEGQTDHTP